MQGYIDAIVNRRDRSMSCFNFVDEVDDSSNHSLTCRSRTMSSMDLRDLDDEFPDENVFDIWANLPSKASESSRPPEAIHLDPKPELKLGRSKSLPNPAMGEGEPRGRASPPPQPSNGNVSHMPLKPQPGKLKGRIAQLKAEGFVKMK